MRLPLMCVAVGDKFLSVAMISIKSTSWRNRWNGDDGRWSLASMNNRMDSSWRCRSNIIFFRSMSTCLRGSGDSFRGVSKARHSCFQTVPSVDCRFPGHTRYAVITVIFLAFFPCNVIQLHRPTGLEPCERTRPTNLLLIPVIVSPGLYRFGKS